MRRGKEGTELERVKRRVGSERKRGHLVKMEERSRAEINNVLNKNVSKEEN